MIGRKNIIASALLAIQLNDVVSFTVSPTSPNTLGQIKRTSELYFGIPTFGGKDDKKDESSGESSPVEEKKIGLSGLVQLITAGMGSPFLGDFEGVDEETGNLMFSLEANNLVDEDGNSKQTQMPYFESGWVDEADLEKQKNGFKFPWQK